METRQRGFAGRPPQHQVAWPAGNWLEIRRRAIRSVARALIPPLSGSTFKPSTDNLAETRAIGSRQRNPPIITKKLRP